MTFAQPEGASGQPVASPASTRAKPLPAHVQFALLRGMHAELSAPKEPESDRALARMVKASFLTGLTVWGFVLYALSSTVLSLSG